MTGPGSPENRDRLLARYYDLEYRDHMDDIAFYVQFASAMDPDRKRPVLELGCGTGRVALALAEAGFDAVAVDLSEGMLETARERAAQAAVGDRIRWVRADMRALPELPRTPFNVAVCPLNTFAYLGTTADQVAMLTGVRSVLVQRGILLLDLTPPRPDLLVPSDGELMLQGSYRDEQEQATVHKLVAGRTSYSDQTQDVTIFYDREGDDGTFSRVSQQLCLRWTGRYEMELLLGSCGYRLEHTYGGYELDDYGEGSDRMIFVART
jgi:SAM-dependent methyltransferase